MKRAGLPALLALPALVGSVLFLVNQGPVPAQAPESWRQLALPEFVAQITPLTTGTTPLADSLWDEIRSQSAERLLGALAGGAAADYGDLVSLYLWARPVLSPEQIETALAGLVPTSGQVAAWPLARLREVHARMQPGQFPPDTLHALTVAWLEPRDVRTIEDVEDLAWLSERLQEGGGPERATQALTVEWTGWVEAREEGTYTFCLPPFDLNLQHQNLRRTQSVSLWLDGERLLTATPDAWQWESASLPFAAGQRREFRMELAYAISRPELFRERPAVAAVLWERQGGRRAVVPPSAWWTPAEDQHGLQGVYALLTPAGPVEFTRIDPSLEFVWSGGALLNPRSAELRRRLQEHWYTRMRTWETWAAWEHGEAARSDAWVGASDAFLAALTLAQQREWLDQLLAHPAVLADATPRAAQRLYRGCRFGAPDEALRMISQWAQAQADEAPDLTADFYAAQRAVYRELAQQLVWQYRPHLAAFAEAALELPDGGCALPAAYTLAYGYWTQGQLGDWIAQLDARLASAQLVGDRRVNWLLARAQAEEIRLSPVGRDTWTVDRFLAGRGWLEEAVLTAQAEATRLRAYRELTARYAADEQWSAADQSWDAAAGRCTGASSQAMIAAWRAQLADLPAAAAARRAAQEQQAQESYVARLRARYEGAVARGDAETMTRYRARLAAAGASVP